MSQDIQERQQSLWMDGEGMRDIRQSWIADAVLGHAYCAENPRPEKGSDKQDTWDAHYFAKSLSLEMFFPPRECMQIFAAAQENRLQALANDHPDRDPEKEVVICDLQNVKAVNSVPDRFKGGLKMEIICQMEAGLSCRDLPQVAIDRINAQLEKAGAPEDLRINADSADLVYHSFETILDNPKVASENAGTDSSFKLMNRTQLATIYSDDGDGPKDLTDTAVMEFLESDHWNKVKVSPRSNYYAALKEAGLEKGPLLDAVRESQGDSKLFRAITGAVRTLFIAHKMGLVSVQKVVRGEDIYYRENFGRIALYLQRSVSKGKHLSGILPEYRKTLDKVDSGKRNPGVFLGRTGTLDPNLPRQWYRTAVGWMSGAIIHSTSEGRTPDAIYRSVAATKAYRKNKVVETKTGTSKFGHREIDLPF